MEEKIFFKMVKKLVKEQIPPTNIDAIAKEAGLKKGTYWSYRKKGNLPRADVAVKIAGILGTTVEVLVTGNKPVFREDSIKEKEDMYQRLNELEKTIKQCKEKFL